MQRTRNHAAYFMILLTYVLFVVAAPRLIDLIIAPLMILHAVTVDLTYSKMLSRKLGKRDFGLMALNAVPYLFLFRLTLLIPALIFSLSIILSYSKINVIPQVLGTLGLSSLLLPWISIAQSVTPLDVAVYMVWCAYTLVESIYVEYKLPFRNLRAGIVRIVWALSLLICVITSLAFPPVLVSLVEPSIRFMRPGEKLRSASQIKELGKRGSKRTILLFALLAVALILYHTPLTVPALLPW
ncbi:hypothetical protein [Metallosphaera hakonensis]|uniref:Uncharacterized protein n=1 Tax=Metallosphaera hakonensis JCM 8857 = DSM 7519 TaxID=1293036 RepID=A0A2U9IQT0_9CREN|nr:hypothetical protein [Metallosphaera hakonensis]AWR98408.1 hypothetical protein DFR87_00315 [Metallosphaera hakonensis JCM 8857 = DSM 7519]